MSDWRLLALDLDGTVLDGAGQIRPDTLAAIQRVQKSGAEVMLVTGRHHALALPFHAQLGLNTPAICCNGAYLYDYASAVPLMFSSLSSTLALAVLAWAEQCDLHALVYVDDALLTTYADQRLQGLRVWAATLPVSLRPCIRVLPEGLRDEVGRGGRIWKIVVSHPQPAVIAQALQCLPDAAALSAEWSWQNRVDIVLAGNSKGQRLAEYAATRSIAARNVVAIGDHQNDLSMLSWAGCGVAMGNAAEDVKAAADVVTQRNDQGGIANVIDRLWA